MLKVPITFNGHPLGTGDLVNTGSFIASSGNTLATVATTGNYADLLSQPTKLSQFTNDLASSGGGGGAPHGPSECRLVSNERDCTDPESAYQIVPIHQ